MNQSIPLSNLDPMPQPPERPLASDCCDSGCPSCVHDVYAEEMDYYRKALAAWKQRHPDIESSAS